VIPPVLDLLNTAFTFQGAPGAKAATALAAPQAALISAIAQGLLNGNFDWRLIEIGAGIGVVVIIIDELLRKAKRGGLPPLAVGMGIYLPMALTLLVPIGALLGWIYDKWAARTSNPEFAQRMGVLLATGLIVGESIMGVVYAAIVAATQKDAPLALVAENPWAVPIGIVVFAATVLGFYAWTRRETNVALAG
jgi:putative OPT family oligopeptide transporter